MLRSAGIAEWILALVTTQEHAAAMVGDCLEDTRGAIAFWWFILRTTFSLCGREAWESRWRILLLSLYGVVMEALLIAVFVLTPGMLWLSVNWALGGKDDAPALSGWLVSIISTAIVPWIVGRMVAKRSGGREIVAGFGYCWLREMVALAVGLAVAVHLRDSSAITWFTLGIDPLFVMAGALTWRARHPRAA
jgi:hypothetical protein